MSENYVNLLKAEYPKRGGAQGWGMVRRLIPQRLAEGATWEDILAGTIAYRKWCEATGKTGSKLVKMASTFYGRDCWFAEDYPLPYVPEQLTGDALRESKLNQHAAKLGCAPRATGESLDDYHERIALAWRRTELRAVK